MKPRAAEVYLRPGSLGWLAKTQRLGASLRFASHSAIVASVRRYLGHMCCTSTYMRPIPDMTGDAP